MTIFPAFIRRRAGKIFRHAFIFWAALLLLPSLAAADEPGWFGMAMKVSASGVADPVIKTITITQVDPGSPAAQAGMVTGDSIVEIDDISVNGCLASQARQVLTKAAGEKLALRLQRADGTTYSAALVAVKKPD